MTTTTARQSHLPDGFSGSNMPAHSWGTRAAFDHDTETAGRHNEERSGWLALMEQRRATREREPMQLISDGGHLRPVEIIEQPDMRQPGTASAGAALMLL